jgi:hypothetical protein
MMPARQNLRIFWRRFSPRRLRIHADPSADPPLEDGLGFDRLHCRVQLYSERYHGLASGSFRIDTPSLLSARGFFSLRFPIQSGFARQALDTLNLSNLGVHLKTAAQQTS